jgi:hypothetical protein
MPEERHAAPVSTPIEAAIHPVLAEVAAPIVTAEPVAVAREAVTATPAVHIEPAPVAAPVRSEPTRPPAPIVDIEKALQESGLVLVKTDPSKVKFAEPVAEVPRQPPPPRPRRAPPQDTGPLQIVETKK